MKQIRVFRYAMASPDDLTALREDLEQGRVKAEEVVAVMGKTEGNGCVNDYTRGYTAHLIRDLLQAYGQNPERVALAMSGGTEGVLSPHLTVFCRTKDARNGLQAGPALAIGIARTGNIPPAAIGRRPQVFAVAEAVRTAMAEAGIDNPADVHFVQVKCPLLSSGDLARAVAEGTDVATSDTYESMGYSRGASALGVGVALGEIRHEDISDDRICRDWSLYSSKASTSAGSELAHCEVIVIGNSSAFSGDLFIDHEVMRDALDVDAVRRLAARMGLTDGSEGRALFVQLFAKVEASPDGRIRGRRHTMLNDSDIHHTRHARAAVGAILASCFGDPMIYVSGGAEHQGPPGGGPVAVIARRL